MHSVGALKLPPHSPQPFNARPLQNKNILNAPRPRGDGRQNFRETPRRSWDAGYSAPSTPLNPAKLLLNLPQITSVIFPLRISARFCRPLRKGYFLSHLSAVFMLSDAVKQFQSLRRPRQTRLKNNGPKPGKICKNPPFRILQPPAPKFPRRFQSNVKTPSLPLNSERRE